MNESLISLIAIFVGIFSASLFVLNFKKYSFGITGNTILSVFGSVFFTKVIARFGINPFEIANTGNLNFTKLFIYLFISVVGAIVLLVISKKIEHKINKSEN